MTVKETLQKIVTKRNAEIEEIKACLEALAKINNESENEEELKATGEEIDALNAKKAELEAELEEINKQIAELDKPVEEEQPQRAKFNFMKEERGNKTMNLEERKARAEEFVKTRRAAYEAEEVRSTLISSGTLAQPTEVDGIHDNGFPKVSSILDLVKVVNCQGMGSNKVAYVVNDPVGAAHVEGAVISESDPAFGFVEIRPDTYAVMSAISKEAKKQTSLQYESKVRELALVALRKVAAKAVTDKVVASTLTTALSLTKIDEKALRTIAFNYGGAEGIEGEAYLFLNKKDLIKFGDARGANEKKAVYEITPDASNPNTGIIKDGGLAVKYCLDNNLTEGTLLYGQPKNIELDLFSNYEVEVSSDFYFNKLMDAIRGDVQLGADVIVKDGLVKVTVSA